MKPIKRKILPWDGNDPSGQWNLHRWHINTKTGTLCRLSVKISHEDNPETGRKEWVGSAPIDKLPGFSHEVDHNDMARIYEISATKEISIIDAAIEHVGSDTFPPAFLEEAKTSPCYMADERYSTKPDPDLEPEPEVVKPAEPKKKRRRSKKTMAAALEEKIEKSKEEPAVETEA